MSTGAHMGMVVLYARLTPAELDRAIADPNWARQRVEQLQDDEHGPVLPDVQRLFELGKAWDGIRYLLSRHGGAPVDFVAGGAQLTDEDWGYGPPSYLPPKLVLAVAEFVQRTPFESLADYYDEQAFNAAGIYPDIWDRPEALEFLWHNYEALRKFLMAAAAHGDAVLFWLT